MAALTNYNYTTDYAEFAIGDSSEISKLPTTHRGGTDELAAIDRPIKAGIAYTTDGNFDIYTLDAGTDVWNKNQEA